MVTHGVILGLYWGYIGVILGLYRDYIGVILSRLLELGQLPGPAGESSAGQGFGFRVWGFRV